MSRFDDLDHRLGRHENSPNMDCSICVPALAVNREQPWSGAQVYSVAPAFPAFGDLWHHRGDLVVFVKANPGAEPKDAGGFWTDVRSKRWLDPKEGSILDALMKDGANGVQLEMGSGNWAPSTQTVMIENTIPEEAALSSPLGVNILKWATEQSHAKMIVEMSKKGLFPISEIVHERREMHITRTTAIQSHLRAVPIPTSALS